MSVGMPAGGMNGGMPVGAQGGVGGPQGLGAEGGENGIMQQIKKVIEDLMKALGLDQQAEGQGGCQGCNKGGGAGGAQGAGGAGGEQGGGSPLDLLRKLRDLAKENPQAVMQALQQVPQLAQLLGGALPGQGGMDASAGGGAVA